MRTLEERVAFLCGQVLALTHMCTAIVAMSPIRPLITDAFKELSSIVPEGEVSAELEPHYRAGMAKASETWQGLLKTAALPRPRSPGEPHGRS